MIRVLIVDDSVTIRKTVTEQLRNEGLQVVGEAADGREALSLTHQLRPDVVLMDVVMPRVDGLDATRRIMDEIPTPVVILSGHANQQEVFKTYDALAAGALEVCAKPGTDGPQDQAEWDRILMTIQAAAQVRVTRLRSGVITSNVSSSAPIRRPVAGATGPGRKIVVIGASTGGPVAVKEILGNLSREFPLPILVVVHGNSGMSSSIACWFDRECSLHVSDACHGELLPKGPGVVLTAPPGRNLRICRGRTVLEDATNNCGCTPSVDELFMSAADSYGDKTIGILLTGMGNDGARGLKHIRDRGGCTIAQNKDSCVVFGMPAVAIKLGAAQHVTPLQEIPRLLTQLATSSHQTRKPTGEYS